MNHKLILTWEELCSLKGSLDAVHSQGSEVEQSVLSKVDVLYQNELLEQKRVAECTHEFKHYLDGRHCVSCGCPE